MRKGIWILAPLLVAAIVTVVPYAANVRKEVHLPVEAPASSSAIPTAELFSVLDKHARAAFESAELQLGRTSQRAFDATRQTLDADSLDQAHAAEVEYVSDDHIFRLSLAYSAAETEGDQAAICKEMVRAGFLISCEVRDLENGDTAIEKVKALAVTFAGGAVARSEVVPRDQLDSFTGDLWFKRSVEMINGTSLQVTSASEMVKSRELDSALGEMYSNVQTLYDLASDSHLVLAEPRS